VKNNLTHRIAFYTGKLSQYFSVHPAKKRPAAHTFRLERLKAYQKLMHEQIAVEHPRLAKKYMG
jgi:hypothetical protein